MKRILSIILTTVLLLGALAACGEQGMEGWGPSDIQLDAKYEEDANIALYPAQAAIFVSAEERVELIDRLNHMEWQEYVTKTAYGYIFYVGDTRINYCTWFSPDKESILNDWTHMRHVRLTEEQRAFFDSLIFGTLEDITALIQKGSTPLATVRQMLGPGGDGAYEGTLPDDPQTHLVRWDFGYDGSFTVYYRENAEGVNIITDYKTEPYGGYPTP